MRERAQEAARRDKRLAKLKAQQELKAAQLAAQREAQRAWVMQLRELRKATHQQIAVISDLMEEIGCTMKKGKFFRDQDDRIPTIKIPMRDFWQKLVPLIQKGRKGY